MGVLACWWLLLRLYAPAAPSEAETAAAALVMLEQGKGGPAALGAAAQVVAARLPPAEVERLLGGEPARLRAALAHLGEALCAADRGSRAPLGGYLASWARQRAALLVRRGTWSTGEVEALLAFDLLDAGRFAADGAFRTCVLAQLPADLDPEAPPPLREELLGALNRLPAVDFAAAEALAAAWGAAPRRSSERQMEYGREPLRFASDADGELRASLYSLPSPFFAAAPVAALLRAVRALAPRRQLLAFVDPLMHRELAAPARALGVELLPTWGRPFSPWPRDPFSLVHRPGGGALVLVRPNSQRGREEDLHMGEALVAGLPAALDQAWGGVRWARAPLPFHNGQILLAHDAAWISIHTLEPRILALLGAERVPVESFVTTAGIDGYVAAARRAAAELEPLLGRPVRFVHPLPEPGGGDPSGAAGAPQQELMRSLGGGAGYDLDSLLTLLPAPDGRATAAPSALVASLEAGRSLLGRLGPRDWSALRRGYELGPEGRALAAALGQAQRTERASALDGFLDLVAAQLATLGWRVRRLPLLVAPIALLRDRGELAHPEFLVSWNNVVLERRRGELRAEGFSSLLAAGDREARALFEGAGCRLDLLPPLVHSVILNGGYRCASNHWRAGSG